MDGFAGCPVGQLISVGKNDNHVILDSIIQQGLQSCVHAMVLCCVAAQFEDDSYFVHVLLLWVLFLLLLVLSVLHRPTKNL